MEPEKEDGNIEYKLMNITHEPMFFPKGAT